MQYNNCNLMTCSAGQFGRREGRWLKSGLPVEFEGSQIVCHDFVFRDTQSQKQVTSQGVP